MRDIVERLRNSASGLCSEDPHKYMARGITAGDCLEAAETILALREEVEAMKQALADPNAVHVNILRGGIARPSLAQIVHIYGRDALTAALATEQTP